MAKSVNQIREQFRKEYDILLPNLDLSEGSVERDVLIEAPLAGGLIPIWAQLNLLEKTLKIFEKPDDLPFNLVDTYISNFGISRNPETPATGVVIFSTEIFSDTITIPSGTKIQTLSSSPIVYTVTETVVFSAIDAPIFFNANTNKYEFTAYVQSVELGRGTGVGKNTLNQIVNPINGISSVTNPYSISDGLPFETNNQVLARLSLKLIGKNTNSKNGLEAFLLTYSNDISILKYGDEGFTRTKYPGGVDVYVPEEILTEVTQTFTVPSPNLGLDCHPF